MNEVNEPNSASVNEDDEVVEKVENEESEAEISLDDTQVTDNVGDVSVEINVEALIADIEASEDKDAARKKEIRRRLEDMAEERSFEDTYAVDLGDEK